ncbi:ParB/Srx family N-terminal domain-containing protein [Vibrio parahaemolyticus]|nr:ParB/Srx family N-terminal domain-containing protein [Vibrio parahaemolyticus]MDF4668705.1 ParB/Srx family N-terminal domain-containing protein [Vibrio parahaemolyticus]HAV1412746.1 ParB N-terminal domain-containing protein [Vibrio parahaemolyticus]HAV2004829.1 ParB N-terminal domain-containing protein [Vibrio parahaemolyticus]
MSKTDFYKHQVRKVVGLKEYAQNPNIHDDANVNEIANSIREFGFTQPVLIDENSVILAGHGRVMAAKRLGMSEVPCIVLEGLTDTQKKAYVIADNKLAENSVWDEKLLAGLVEELINEDFCIETIGYDQDELDLLLKEYTDTPFNLAGGQSEKKTKERKITDDKYVQFECIMEVANKKKLVQVLNEVQQHGKFESKELALMELIKLWESTRKSDT